MAAGGGGGDTLGIRLLVIRGRDAGVSDHAGTGKLGMLTAVDVCVAGTAKAELAFSRRGCGRTTSFSLACYGRVVQNAHELCSGKRDDDGGGAVHHDAVARPSGVRSMTVPLPGGPGQRVVHAAWFEEDGDEGDGQDASTHAIIPTAHGSDLRRWNHAFVLVGVEEPGEAFGDKPAGDFARWFRFDHLEHGGFATIGRDRVRFATMAGSSAPAADLWTPLAPRSPEDRRFIGVCGASAIDETAQRVITFVDAGMHTFILVCGCVVRNGLVWETNFVPLELLRQFGEDEPCRIRDVEGGVSIGIHHDGMHHEMVVDTQRRRMHGGVPWLEIRGA